MAFRVLIIGGTGQVGAAVVRALAAEPSCAEVVMVNRRAISLTADPRVRQVILDLEDRGLFQLILGRAGADWVVSPHGPWRSAQGGSLADCRQSWKTLWAARGILARQYLRVHEALKIEQVVHVLHGPQNGLVGHAGLTVTRSDSTPP